MNFKLMKFMLLIYL